MAAVVVVASEKCFLHAGVLEVDPQRREPAAAHCRPFVFSMADLDPCPRLSSQIPLVLAPVVAVVQCTYTAGGDHHP